MTPRRNGQDLAPLSKAELDERINARLSEATWMRQVQRLAESLGWWTFHVPANVRRCPHCRCRSHHVPTCQHQRCGTFDWTNPGLADLLLIKPPRMVWLEIKRDHGQPSPAQQRFLAMARACGQTAEIVWPSDRERVYAILLDEQTSPVLRALRLLDEADAIVNGRLAQTSPEESAQVRTCLHLARALLAPPIAPLEALSTGGARRARARREQATAR